MLRIQPNPDSVLALSPVETQTPARGGHLLLMGGGFKPLEVLERFVQLAEGGERPVVADDLGDDRLAVRLPVALDAGAVTFGTRRGRKTVSITAVEA